MPDPITASVVIKTMAKGAIAKVGGKIIESVAPGIFSKDKDFGEIKLQLTKIAKQLDEVLSIARDTFALVEQLPNIVSDLIDEQTLYLARTKIESSIQVYINLNVKPNTISYEELTNLLQSWNILIDKEKKTQVINRLPRYGEYLLAATDGKLYNAVKLGVTDKLTDVEKAYEVIGENIVTLAKEAESIISGKYIKSGSITDEEPWVVWVAEGTKTKTVTRTISMPCSACNGSIDYTFEEEVPDTAWNNELKNKKDRLAQIKASLETLSNQYRSLIVSAEVLRTFLKSLTEREDSITSGASNLKVVEIGEPFTTV